MARHKVNKCGHCGALDVMVNVHQIQCHACGKTTWYGSGKPVLDLSELVEGN
jgi:hypothetical protein